MGIKTPYTTYCASKVLLVAEKVAFWISCLSLSLLHASFNQLPGFYEQHKPQIKWDHIVVINPPFVSLFLHI